MRYPRQTPTFRSIFADNGRCELAVRQRFVKTRLKTQTRVSRSGSGKSWLEPRRTRHRRTRHAARGKQFGERDTNPCVRRLETEKMLVMKVEPIEAELHWWTQKGRVPVVTPAWWL